MMKRKSKKRSSVKVYVSFFDAMLILALNFALIFMGMSIVKYPAKYYWAYLLPIVIAFETYIVTSMDVVQMRIKNKKGHNDEDEFDY